MFITFEGIDASGKTTQMELLGKTLAEEGYQVLATRQPGGTKIGHHIREILLNPENREMVPETEMLLYVADRIQHIKEVIEPALKQNTIVLCDRYHDATLAYQGGGRGLDISWLKPFQEAYIRVPDLTLWFDVSVQESQNRLNRRNISEEVENCRLEREDIDFFERIRKTYQEMTVSEPDRFVRIDAEADIPEIEKTVLKTVYSRLIK